MYHFVEAEAWCAARGKRLCYDDEWLMTCIGPEGWKYPYGDTHIPGVCNDDKLWLTYIQEKLNGWPNGVSTPDIETLAELLDAASAKNSGGAIASEHVKWLYQGDPSGFNEGCVNDYGIYDLCGNVEEWTHRRDGGTTGFHGNLKGRYWAETRDCRDNIFVHGDYFRFYEIGFRCCADPYP